MRVFIRLAVIVFVFGALGVYAFGPSLIAQSNSVPFPFFRMGQTIILSYEGATHRCSVSTISGPYVRCGGSTWYNTATAISIELEQ